MNRLVPMRPVVPMKPRRWFLYGTSILLVVLCLSIILASMLLMRQGMLVREGIITGSSMEPHFEGPRLEWVCPTCNQTQRFHMNTMKLDRGLRCQGCSTQCDEATLESIGTEVGNEMKMRTLPGESVRIARLRTLRQIRSFEISAGKAHSSGLRRGDVVVFQDSETSIKEVKRLVGFPDEQIEVRDGDLFVDGVRYAKHLHQLLRECVLVSHHDQFADTSPDLPGEVRFERSLVINNAIPGNAHDSHELVPAKDIGIAARLAVPPDGLMKFDVSVLLVTAIRNDLRQRVELRIVLDQTGLSLLHDEVELKKLGRPVVGLWLVCAIVDGYLVVGSEKDEWYRAELSQWPIGEDETKSNFHDDDENKAVVLFSSTSNESTTAAEKLLLFRDLEWRGVNDARSQSWDKESGIVLLGDNISCSSDSRDRWLERPALTVIKGVVIEPENPIENLLRQVQVLK
jgi:hypothetical protein